MTAVRLTLYTSSFCGACSSTRATVEHAAGLLGDRLDWQEVNVADAPDESERVGIVSTPTVVLTAPDGTESFRASGVPTAPQLLTAIAAALPAQP